MVIGHSDCGVQHINSDMMIKHMMDRGVDEEKIEPVSYTHLDVYKRQDHIYHYDREKDEIRIAK